MEGQSKFKKLFKKIIKSKTIWYIFGLLLIVLISIIALFSHSYYYTDARSSVINGTVSIPNDDFELKVYAQNHDGNTPIKGSYNSLSSLPQGNYVFNSAKTKCSNGMQITYSLGNFSVTANQKGKCKVYFDYLPEQYEALDYIQSSGTQFINTGVIINSSSNVSMDVNMHAINIPNWTFGVNGYMQYPSATVADKDVLLKIDYKNYIETVYENGVQTYNRNWQGAYNGVNLPLGILKMGNTNNTWYDGGASAKLYYANVYQNDVLVRNLVPAVRLSDGEPGMYDLLDGTFYTNAGSGDFTYDSGTLWGRFIPVEYIEAHGTEYIDTGYIPNNNSKIDITYSTNNVANDGVYVYGSADTGANDKSFELYTWSNNSAQTWEINTGAINWAIAATADTKYKFSVDAKNKTYSVLNANNGTSLGSGSLSNVPTFTSPNSLYLAALHRTSGAFVSAATQLRFYVVKLYDNDTLVRFMIPAKDTKTNTYGLYDMVANKFYRNKGTGAFTGGGEIKKIDYLQSEGAAYLKVYTGTTNNTFGMQATFSMNTPPTTASGDYYSAGFGTEGSNAKFCFWSIQVTKSSRNTTSRWLYAWGNGGLSNYNSSSSNYMDATSNNYKSGLDKYYTTKMNYQNDKRIYKFGSSSGITLRTSSSGGGGGGGGGSYYFTNTATSSDFYLFRCASYTSNTVQTRFKSVQLTEGSNIIRDLIPIKINNVGYMLDTLNWDLYGNVASSGSFTLGPEI